MGVKKYVKFFFSFKNCCIFASEGKKVKCEAYSILKHNGATVLLFLENLDAVTE